MALRMRVRIEQYYAVTESCLKVSWVKIPGQARDQTHLFINIAQYIDRVRVPFTIKRINHDMRKVSLLMRKWLQIMSQGAYTFAMERSTSLRCVQ